VSVSQNRNRDFSIILKNSRKKLTRARFFWAKLKVFAFVIGVFLTIQKDLKTFGTSKNQEFIESFKSLKDEKLRVLIFHPKGKFKLFWNLMITFLLFYTATVLPYRVCFNYLQTSEWVLADLIIDCLFFTDILINFNTGIISISGKLTLNRHEIAKKYIKSWFILDLISCLPLDYIFSNEPNTTILNKMLRILKVTRLYRIAKILRLLKLMRFFRSQFIHSLSQDHFFQSRVRRSFMFLVAIFLFVHITGCIWFYISSTDDLGQDSWIIKFSILDKPEGEVYITCIYFVFTTFTTVGYGDIVPTSISEKVFTMALLGFGVAFYSYMISAFSSSISKQDEAVQSLKARNKRLKRLFKEIDLPEEAIFKVKQQLKMNLIKEFTDSVNIEKLLTELPSHIRNSILTHYNQKYVEGINFFNDKPSAMVNGMVQYFHVSGYFLKETLYEKNDPSEEVYFIKSGKVLLKNDSGVAFWVYPKGNYFGDIEVLMGGHRLCTASVGTPEAEIYSINHRYFIDLLKECEPIFETTKTLAEARKLKILESLKDVEGNLNTCSFASEDIEDETLIKEEPLNMARKDTGYQMSLKNDNPIKRKNRKLWGTVIFGRSLMKIRNKKSKTLLLRDNRTRHSSLDDIKKERKMTCEKKVSFPRLSIERKEERKFSGDGIKSFEISERKEEIKDEIKDELKGLGIEEIFGQDLVFGPREVEERLENKVRCRQFHDVFKSFEISSNNYRKISGMLVSLEKSVL
jgi:hyperpolarization activated cyclic nucleotide-gated potassium channel 1